MLNSPAFQFVAPPLIFLVFHVLLHYVSRVGLLVSPQTLFNAGVHFAVLAASVQFATLMYYMKLASSTSVHATSIQAATPFAAIMFAVSMVAGIVVALVDRWFHSWNAAASTSSHPARKAQARQVLSILIPTVIGFMLFGFVVVNIVGVGIMPDVH